MADKKVIAGLEEYSEAIFVTASENKSVKIIDL